MRNKFVATVFFILFTTTFLGQSFQGIATYEQKLSSEDFEKKVLDDPNMDPVMKKFIESKMKKILRKMFILSFNKNTSVYKEQEKLDIANEGANSSWSPYGMVISIYKDLQTKQRIVEKDIMSKMFGIQDTLVNYNWQSETSTKQIGTYLCNKAIAIIPVSDKERMEYEKEKANQESNKTQFMKLEEPKEKTITVWYTTDIPVGHGPESYWGLPGLILEVNDGKNILLCSKVILNPKEKFKIQKPKSKSISHKEYDKIVEAKLKEIENTNFKQSK